MAFLCLQLPSVLMQPIAKYLITSIQVCPSQLKSVTRLVPSQKLYKNLISRFFFNARLRFMFLGQVGNVSLYLKSSLYVKVKVNVVKVKLYDDARCNANMYQCKRVAGQVTFTGKVGN